MTVPLNTLDSLLASLQDATMHVDRVADVKLRWILFQARLLDQIHELLTHLITLAFLLRVARCNVPTREWNVRRIANPSHRKRDGLAIRPTDKPFFASRPIACYSGSRSAPTR